MHNPMKPTILRPEVPAMMNEQPKRQGISRRDLLASVGATAAGMLLLNEVSGADNPAANVGDRASSIKITGFKTYPAGSKTLLIQFANAIEPYDVVDRGTGGAGKHRSVQAHQAVRQSAAGFGRA
jgi:hypothetical protein